MSKLTFDVWHIIFYKLKNSAVLSKYTRSKFTNFPHVLVQVSQTKQVVYLVLKLQGKNFTPIRSFVKVRFKSSSINKLNAYFIILLIQLCIENLCQFQGRTAFNLSKKLRSTFIYLEVEIKLTFMFYMYQIRTALNMHTIFHIHTNIHAHTNTYHTSLKIPKIWNKMLETVHWYLKMRPNK